MRFPQYGTLEDGLAFLSKCFERIVTRSEFFNVVVALRLPLYASTPRGNRIMEVCTNGLLIPKKNSTRSRMALLRRRSVQELWTQKWTTTSCPALDKEDDEFLPWIAIKEQRKVMNNPAYTRETLSNGDWEQGDYYGETDKYCFEKAIHVTDENLILPIETVDEIVLEFSNKIDDKTRSIPLVDRSQSDFLLNSARALKGINKDNVITAFQPLVKIKLGAALANNKALFFDALVQRGARGKKDRTLWNPVILAVGFYDKYQVPKVHLNRTFFEYNFLADYREGWKEMSSDF